MPQKSKLCNWQTRWKENNLGVKYKSKENLAEFESFKIFGEIVERVG
jgi:hypothetical protein